MRLDHLFFLYMAATGAAAAAILIVAPQAGDFFIKPYFWVLFAVAAFDLVTYAYTRAAPGKMLGAVNFIATIIRQFESPIAVRIAAVVASGCVGCVA